MSTAPHSPYDPESGSGLAAAVLDRARRHPAAPAVVDGAHTLDYADLDRVSAAVAHALHRHGVRPGQAVAVGLPRSWRLVCTMLGVLRLGAVVVPLDAQSPPERRRHILTDSGSVAVVHGASAPGDLPDGVRPLPVAALIGAAGSGAPDPAGDTALPPGPTATAAPVSFVFYTSGTTGLPKGVEVRDAGILRLAAPGYLDMPEGARYSCLSNPAFDALSFEVWAPLLTGGTCVVVDDETAQTPDALAAELGRLRIDTLFMTVALFNAVVDKVPHAFAGIGQILVGGEQLNARLIRRWYRDNAESATRLHNVYGPTEATTFALCHPIPRDFDGDVVPIGRALPGTGTLAVTEGLRPAEVGEVAELCLSGEALAVGYRNLPDETARRFVTFDGPDGTPVRHYRTGDLVRLDAAGNHSYVGRADRQVKVRGFRIEPGELERRIVAHPAVRQAYVCTRRDASGVNELLAYLVLGAELSFDGFHRHLDTALPAYMRPHRTYLVEELPLNANGKVDRDALLRRDDAPWRRADAAPGNGSSERADLTDRQREVLALVEETLGAEGLRLDDRWIACGGDSLKALRLRYEARRRWGCELSPLLVLRSDFAELAAATETAGADGASPYPALTPAADGVSAPATSEQQRLWLFQQREPDSRAYSVPMSFRIEGAVDTAALRTALRRLVARHAALRTSFTATPEGLRQTVGAPYDPWIEPTARALRSAEDRAKSTASFFTEPFDLARPEMFAACWLPAPQTDGAGGGELLLRLHHIAVDGWSLNVLFAELSADYARARAGADADATAGTTAPTPLDFAHWQSEWFTRDAYRAQRTELAALYGDLPQEGAPLEPLRAVAGPAGRLLRTALDTGRRTALDRLCADLGLTRFQLLLGVYAWSLYGVTGSVRPRIAGPVAGRPVQELSDSVGMFANTVLLPLGVEPHGDLRTQLSRYAAAARGVLDHQDVLLADVIADGAGDPGRSGGGGTPFDFMFVLENTDFDALALPGCVVRPLWQPPVDAKCPLTLSVIERATGFDCLWEYDARHFDGAEVAALSELFERGLDALTAPSPTGTGTLAELVAPYRRSLPEPGRAATAPLAFATVAEGFAQQVRRTPGATALVHGETSLTYAELDAHANALAHRIRRLHPLPPQDAEPRSVALFLRPSPEHVVALLALARLNLTAVPLDPAYPAELLRQVLSQAGPLCVLVAPDDARALDAIAQDGPPHHHIALAPAALDAPAEPGTVIPPHDGARPLYTLFTSGSTGTPKGVRVPDRTLCNLLQWQREHGGLAAPAVTQQFSMLSFDVSFQEVFGTLCGGGTLRLVRPEWRHDAPALLDQLEAGGAERLFLPYVALNLLAEHGVRLGRYPSRLREVVTAGEQLLCTDAIRRWFAGLPGARLFNHYGPTETHVVSALCLDGDPAAWPERPAIGAPVTGAWLRVVDEADEPVPPGRPGRLLIGGPMAAPCYLGDTPLNTERFVELPGSGTFYRSGDLARFDGEGLLHYLGRDDQQIKLSGHRLELGQVEAALLRHPDVVNAVVVRDGERLVACLEFNAAATADATAGTPDAAELARHLAPLLPPYVRIDRFRRLAKLPLAPSGKLDRRAALTAPGDELRSAAADAPALSPTEARLTELFAEALNRPIAPDERFFDAGATSLDLMRFQLRCTAEPDLGFTVPDLFEHVTVRRLARFLDGGTESARPARAAGPARTDSTDSTDSTDEPIAVIGMAVRLPGADDLASFWDLVRTGARGSEHFDVDPAEAAAGRVGVRSQMSGLLSFDPEHFGISRQEARLMDPQQRHLLMSSVQALAHAGLSDPAGRRIGLVAGCGENTYFQSMLREADAEQLPDGFQLALHHDKDFLTTKVAYHLDLTGPALTVQAACASSLVAVHVAAGMLRQGDADVMLAGGVLVDALMTDGYVHRPQHIFSSDGFCRPFSDDSDGTIGGSGVGVVVLKPLRLARRDGDTVYAVVTGSALNNDGAGKLSYSAPSLPGQREVIRAALRRSGRTGAELGYVEAHGTATRLGDPVEVGALRQAYALSDPGAAPEPESCALTSVKSQIGHLGAAAGVVGLVRAALSVHHGLIPPNVGFRALNPQIGADASPFYVPADARPWPADRPRVAAVSSFGIGGTNAHLVLEADAARQQDGPEVRPLDCLLLSSSSAAGLRADAAAIADYLQARPEEYGRVLRHLQAGRRAHRWRAAAVCADADAAVAWLRSASGTEVTAVDATEVDATADEVTADAARCHAAGLTAADAVDAWLSGRPVTVPAGPAQAPWDFPPPSFALAEYDFRRAAAPALRTESGPADGERPQRLPDTDWLHQPHWVRLGRATASRTPAPGSPTGGLLVALTAAPLPPEALAPFAAAYDRVVRVVAADAFARVADDAYEVDPADPGSLRRLLEALAPERPSGAADPRVDWLHALPLTASGPLDEASLEHARRTCLDTPAALLRAAGELTQPLRLRTWWLSYGAQPVQGAVQRPELGMLAGPAEVAPQECAVDGHWVDLPTADAARWAPQLAALLAGDHEPDALPRRLALRRGYWWRQALLPVPTPFDTTPSALDRVPSALDPVPSAPTGAPATYLVIGGTGGIGRSLAAWLLAHADCRIVLLSRSGRLPDDLAQWAERVVPVAADLATDPLDAVLAKIEAAAASAAPGTGRVDGVVHAVGTAGGGLVARRDAAALRSVTAGKLRGALLTERLIERHRPDFAAYCSSMSALYGGVGQFDYAAANGLLDGFAHYAAGGEDTDGGADTDDGATLRVSIDWDIWSEVGMACDALHADARHQAHLSVGLAVKEGQRLFDQALRLQLPQLLVSTTDIERAREFYAPLAAPSSVPRPDEADSSRLRAESTSEATAARLDGWLCDWLGVDELDPDVSLYDYGADSLTMLDLVAKIDQHYGVDMELAHLGHRVSLNDVLTRIADARTPSPRTAAPAADGIDLAVWQEGTGRDLLCLVHPVGGDIQAYRALVSGLDPHLTVCLIADPALGGGPVPHWSLTERADRYRAALEARFPRDTWRWQLAGWSFGAWVAHAMAAGAEAEGRAVAGLQLLDPPPPDAAAHFGEYDEERYEAVFAHELLQGGAADTSTEEPGTAQGQDTAPAVSPHARAYAERLAHCCRANVAAMADHEPPALARTPSRLWLATRPVADLPELGSPERQRRLWAELLPLLEGCHELDTTHYGIVRQPWVRAVSDTVNAATTPPKTPTSTTPRRTQAP